MTRLEAENILETSGYDPLNFAQLYASYKAREHWIGRKLQRDAFEKVLGEEGYIF